MCSGRLHIGKNRMDYSKDPGLPLQFFSLFADKFTQKTTRILTYSGVTTRINNMWFCDKNFTFSIHLLLI